MSESNLAGDFDESGFLNSLYRKGFTTANAILELVANSLDANSTKIRFDIREILIYMIDNGWGMDEDGFRKMFSMFRENHAGAHTRGVSGFGAKPSTLILCKKQSMTIYTCKMGTTNYLTAIIPWDKMFSEKKYSNMITIRPMTRDEQIEFIKNNPEGHGTIIVLPHNDETRDAILDSFPKRVKKNTPAMDRIGIVFGNDTYECICDDAIEGKQVLKLYNYFGGNQVNYICGITQSTIQQWYHEKSKHTRYLLEEDDQLLEIVPSRGGFSTEPVPFRTNLIGYINVGTYTGKLGLRNDVLPPLDPSNPVELNASFYTGEYDKQYFDGDVLEDYHKKNRLVRNNQRIGYFDTPDIKETSARGNAELSIIYRLLQVDLCYNPTSEQNNHQDATCNIQDVKNQWNGKALPIMLTRLIKYERQKKGKSILEFYNARYNELVQAIQSNAASEAPVVPAPTPVLSKKKKTTRKASPTPPEELSESSPIKESPTEIPSEASSSESPTEVSSLIEVSSSESSTEASSNIEESPIVAAPIVASPIAASPIVASSNKLSTEQPASIEVSPTKSSIESPSIEVSSPTENVYNIKVEALEVLQDIEKRISLTTLDNEWLACLKTLRDRL
jgi:hypothetical protein